MRFGTSGFARKMASSGRLAAIDQERCSSDERRLVGREELDGLGDLFGSSDSIEGNGRRQTRLSLSSTGEAIQHPRIDWTWGDQVNPYPRCGGFERRRLRKPFNCMLARRVHGRASSASMTVRRRHIDDTAAALSKHHAHLMLHAEQRTQDVGIEGRGIGFCGLFRDQAWLALRAGGVYSDIQTAIPLHGLVDQVANVLLAAYIGAHELRF